MLILPKNNEDKYEKRDETNNDDVESIQTIDSFVSEGDDPNQLLDLGKLIITTRSEPNLISPRLDQQKMAVPHASHKTSSTSPQQQSQISFPKQRALPPQPVSRDVHQPLGFQHQPQHVYMSDNYEPEKIRQISQSRVFLNRDKSRNPQYTQIDSPNPSQSSYADSNFSEPFSATSEQTAQTAETSQSIHRTNSIMVDLTNDNYDLTIKKDDRNRTMDQYKSTFDEVDGKYRETIVLDDDGDDGSSDYSVVQPLNVRHKRTKSALSNLEFEKSNRAFSNFSFETVASEVQLHYNDSDKESLQTNDNPRFSLGNFARRYTEANKSVAELCDDTMKSTRQILDDLKRQKTILMRKQAELLRSKKKDEDRLYSVRELQGNLMKSRNLQVKPRPKSYVYGEDLSMRLPHNRQKSNPDNYFDYKNNQSYDFETFMRTQSSTTLL